MDIKFQSSHVVTIPSGMYPASPSTSAALPCDRRVFQATKPSVHGTTKKGRLMARCGEWGWGGVVAIDGRTVRRWVQDGGEAM